MLFRCCLIHVSITIVRYLLYLLYLALRLEQDLLMSYPCDLFLIFIFIMINHIISWIQIYLFFCLFFRICSIIFVGEEWEQFTNSKSLVSGCCLAFARFFCQFQPGVGYKSVAYKIPCNSALKSSYLTARIKVNFETSCIGRFSEKLQKCIQDRCHS